VAALLAAVLASAVDGEPRAALVAWRRDASGHPSPNAGPVEASFAGALGIRLGGVNTYGDRVEDRHVLGDGRAATQHDIARARTLARAVGAAAAATAVLIALRPRR
jgi:adenosylcobinamide-phosphate synthase